MKKILFLINTLDGGGAEKVLVDMVNALDKTKYDITVQTVTDRGIFKERLTKDVNYKSIVKIKNTFLRHVFTYIINFILPPRVVYKLFIENEYDYEVAFIEGVPTKIIAASSNIKSIKYAWVHIDLYNTFGLEKVYKNIQYHIDCYKKYDKIICVSNSAKEAFIKRFGIIDKLTVKYNVINDHYIHEKSKAPIEKSRKMRIVTVGRLEYQKGMDRLLKIHKSLMDEGFEYDLFIIGQGSKRKQLEEYVKNNFLSESVRFIGFTDNPYKYMASADLIVYPSRAEGYSTVAVEAIILGKPVIVTDCSGMREIFGDSQYGLVTENNDEALYNGIKQMITDPELRKRYIEMAKIRSEDFSLKKRVKELETLFS